MSDGSDGFSRPNFIPKLNHNMKKVGFKLINIYGNLRIYSNNDQIVYYYTNTSIPEYYEYLKDKVNDFDTLIVIGHDPDSIFLNTTKNIHFIGNHETCYFNTEFESENSVIYKMHNSNLNKRFNKFSYLSKCNRIYNFNEWNKLLLFIKRKKKKMYHIYIFNILLFYSLYKYFCGIALNICYDNNYHNSNIDYITYTYYNQYHLNKNHTLHLNN